MKKEYLLLILLLCLTNVLQLRAYDFEVNGIYYNYIQGTDNEVEVTYKNDNYDGYNNQINVLIPNSVSYNDITYIVTRIGTKAFYCPTINLSGLSSPYSIDFYDNVTIIGDSAFCGCTNLICVSNYNFNLDNIQIIGNHAFANCSSLQSIIIPDKVISIGDYAYENCNRVLAINSGWNIPLSINATVFKGIPYTCKLFIPSGTYQSYIEKNIWKDFKIIDSSLYGFCSDNYNFYQDYVDHNDSILMYSNTKWKASSNVDWITILTPSGQGSDYCKFNISHNVNPIFRYAEIMFSGEGIEDWKIQLCQLDAPMQKWEYVRSIDNVGKSNDPINKVYAQGENNVYLVGEKGYIAKSIDNALTWNKQYFPTQETFNGIVFCNNELGFIVGNKGTILRTEDAGENWTQLNSGTTQNINAIAATSENNIWAVGNGGLIMQSLDAGENWIIRNYTDNRNLYDIKFKNDTGYIVGDRNEVICVQNRVGLPPYWWLQSAYTNPDEYDKITSLNITDSKVFALVKREGYGNDMIVYTSDNENWSVFSLNSDGHYPPIKAITQIFFQNDNVAYFTYIPFPTTGIVSDGYPFVLVTARDGGKTWNEQELPRLYSIIGRYSDKVDFSSSTDNEYGYLASGTALLRTPYTGDFYVGLPNIKFDESNLSLKQQRNYLQISAASKSIASVEIISVTGVKLLQVNKTEIDISNLSRGIYLIHALFTDKTSETVKWIKR